MNATDAQRVVDGERIDCKERPMPQPLIPPLEVSVVAQAPDGASGNHDNNSWSSYSSETSASRSCYSTSRLETIVAQKDCQVHSETSPKEIAPLVTLEGRASGNSKESQFTASSSSAPFDSDKEKQSQTPDGSHL